MTLQEIVDLLREEGDRWSRAVSFGKPLMPDKGFKYGCKRASDFLNAADVLEGKRAAVSAVAPEGAPVTPQRAVEILLDEAATYDVEWNNHDGPIQAHEGHEYRAAARAIEALIQERDEAARGASWRSAQFAAGVEAMRAAVLEWCRERSALVMDGADVADGISALPFPAQRGEGSSIAADQPAGAAPALRALDKPGVYEMRNGGLVIMQHARDGLWTNGMGDWWRESGDYYPASDIHSGFDIVRFVQPMPAAVGDIIRALGRSKKV